MSIVLSLAVVRLLGGLSVASRQGKRYWPHLLWIVFGLLATTVVWWNFWSFRHVGWNYFSFLLTLTVPAVLYLLAVALVPEYPSRVSSWRHHFYRARTRIFVALSAFFVAVSTTILLLLDMPLLHPIRITQTFALALAVLGAVTRNSRIHAALPVVFLIILITAAAMLFFRPDAVIGTSR